MGFARQAGAPRLGGEDFGRVAGEPRRAGADGANRFERRPDARREQRPAGRLEGLVVDGAVPGVDRRDDDPGLRLGEQRRDQRTRRRGSKKGAARCRHARKHS